MVVGLRGLGFPELIEFVGFSGFREFRTSWSHISIASEENALGLSALKGIAQEARL